MVVGRGEKKGGKAGLFFLSFLSRHEWTGGPSLSTHGEVTLSPAGGEEGGADPNVCTSEGEKNNVGGGGRHMDVGGGGGRTFVSVFFCGRFSCFFREIVADRALSSFFRSTTQCFFIGH